MLTKDSRLLKKASQSPQNNIGQKIKKKKRDIGFQDGDLHSEEGSHEGGKVSAHLETSSQVES